MALASFDTFGLSQHAVYYPEPLYIHKKPRRATFRKRIFRKPTHDRHDDPYLHGPLDDIIDEIKSDIWESLHDYRTTGASLLGSQDDALDGGPVVAPALTETAPWPFFDMPTSYETAHVPNITDAVDRFDETVTHDATENATHQPGGRSLPNERCPSRLRLFTGLSRLRRTDTGDSSGNSGNTSDVAPHKSPAACNGNVSGVELLQEPSDDEAYVRGNARNTIDVIFIIDNAYYVSRECLGSALDAVNSALNHLDRGDRVALYTTHCTHRSVTGNRPNLLYPIHPFGLDTEKVFRAITATIAKCGTQSWKPPRPNPSMADVILGVAKSLKNKNLKDRRTHVVLFSPAAHVMHDVSRSCPDLYIHQINPAAVPYRRVLNIGDVGCNEECCENISISNWSHFQSLPGRLKYILKHARSMKPVGEITKVCIDIRTKDGCEVIECLGAKDITSLRLGQAHTIFANVRTTRSATKAIDLSSEDPVFNSSLNVKDLRMQLQSAVTVGAVKAHLLDVQVYYQNTLHETNCWIYTETPFLVVRDLGSLAPPINTAVEVHRRKLFQKFTQLDVDVAKVEAGALLSTLTKDQDSLTKLVQRIYKEVDRYQRVLDYEREHRQKLPLCPGPIAIEASPHGWLTDAWNRKKSKRQGVAVVDEEEEISGLIDGLYGLERLG
ncbi:hypothetical protein N0V95_002495 [Ascochyta clinopodiicola]|nr:hypothetical protein N0V95_002495 [Ascochyta clinopodiicola]